MTREYDFTAKQHGGTKFHEFTLLDANGVEPYVGFQGQRITEIASALNLSLVDAFFDIVADTDLQAKFTHLSRFVTDAKVVAPILRHRRVLTGGSDGGAHIKFVSQGHWTTDLIVWIARESNEFTVEQMHAKLTAMPASVLGLTDRGTIEIGKSADIMIYDFARLGFAYGQYTQISDLPDGGWRKFVNVEGMRHVLVNGVVTMTNGQPTGATSGQLVELQS